MQEIISHDKSEYELKKAISVIEWDLPKIRNKHLKELREEQLRRLKRELNEARKINQE